MRERLCRWALAAVSLVLCALFALGLLAYTQPMEAQVYDLSFVWEGETPPEGWAFSDKGWTVFTQEGTEKRELVPNGVGGYTGLDFPGQTIYFSRVLAELRERGYVAAAGPEGRYKKRYALTPEGQGITAEIQAAILEINRFVSDGILPEDLAVFYRTLRTITENLEAAVERYLTE